MIQQTAALVDQEMHKVNLSAPDHVILIDIYQASRTLSDEQVTQGEANDSADGLRNERRWR